MKTDRGGVRLFLVLLLTLLACPSPAPAFKRSDLQIDGGATDQERLALIKNFRPTSFHVYSSTNVRPKSPPPWLSALPPWVGDYSLANFCKAQGLQLQASLHMALRQNNYQSAEVRIGIDGTPLWNPLVMPGAGTAAEQRLGMSYASQGFKLALIENVKSGIDQGVRTFEFQDTTADYYSDFSDLSVRKFQAALQGDPRLRTHRDKLLAQNLSLGSFNVRSYAFQRTSGSQLERQRQFLWTQQGDVSRAWLEFCFLQMTDLLSEVIGVGKAYGAAKGVEVGFLLHFLYPREIDIRFLSLFDGLWVESPYNEFAAAARTQGLKGLAVDRYYPPSGIAGAAAMVVAGFDERNTPMWIPWGVAYPELAYKRGAAATLYSIWLAEIYASSGTALLHTSFQPREYAEPAKQGQISALDPTRFSPARPLAGPWRTPQGAGIFTRFVRENARLYDGNRPAASVLLLKPASAYHMGAGPENIYGWAELLADAHVPYAVRLDGVGPERTTRLAPEKLAPFASVIALGLCRAFSDEQVRRLGTWAALPGKTLFVEDGREVWAARFKAVFGGQLLAPIQTVEDLGAAYQNNGRADATVARAAALFPSFLETSLNKNCLVRVEKNTFNGKPSLVVHIVNRNYNWEADSVTPQRNVTLTLRSSGLGLAKGMQADF
ncbi:MAG TPA: hypothetical protein VN419_11305, partial [Humidesulfovibrio sp.]|uniref:hypothetical protein n=1 Tax=Humidesulfovibrio sp. TaxID=2910988 RepID=UPI002B50ABBD